MHLFWGRNTHTHAAVSMCNGWMVLSMLSPLLLSECDYWLVHNSHSTEKGHFSGGKSWKNDKSEIFIQGDLVKGEVLLCCLTKNCKHILSHIFFISLLTEHVNMVTEVKHFPWNIFTKIKFDTELTLQCSETPISLKSWIMCISKSDMKARNQFYSTGI